MKDLQDRVAVVTGSSRGLGRVMAEELAARGAKVVINYVSNKSTPLAEEVLERVRELGSDGQIIQADVSDPIQVQKMFMKVFKDYKRCDILINNAGLTRDDYFLMMRAESWDKLMDVHLDAVYHCSKAVIRQMCAAKRGVIVNIGSGSALVAMPGQVNYSATKAGLMGFTRSLAREVADKGCARFARGTWILQVLHDRYVVTRVRQRNLSHDAPATLGTRRRIGSHRRLPGLR